MSLTEEARQQYLEKKGVHCPFCGSDQIEGGFVDIDTGSAYQAITCLVCGRAWTDIYTLHDVGERAA